MDSWCNDRARTPFFDDSILFFEYRSWFEDQTGVNVQYLFEEFEELWFYLFDFDGGSLADVFEFGFQYGCYFIRTSYHPREVPEDIEFERLPIVSDPGNGFLVPLRFPFVVNEYVESYNELPMPKVEVEEEAPGAFRFRFQCECRGELFLFAKSLGIQHQRADQLVGLGIEPAFKPISIEQVCSFWATNSGLDLKTCSFAEYEAWLEENLPDNDDDLLQASRRC